MEPIYALLRKHAREIGSRYPLPDFYVDFQQEIEQARQLAITHPIVNRLRRFVADHIEDDFGHGLEHADKVTWDAGALMMIEGARAGYPDTLIKRRTLLVECAGLLHDIKRKHENHAIAGAEFSRRVLKTYPFIPAEIEDICQAIRNHEAFKDTLPINTPEGVLVSGCLYDADKFRWGPDNFYDTVWDMVSFSNTPLAKFMAFYPSGMDRLAEIKHTFRTRTGKAYGPQFIDIGLAIGKELYDTIRREYAHLL